MTDCQRCGACCASFRVSFHVEEVDDQPGGRVPAGLVELLSGQLVCMRGTAAAPSRCVALRGRIGDAVSCAIYEFRPSACRDFAPLAAVGSGDEACNEARRRHGLLPLGRALA
ncbi:MAG: YkgJ family cysteine cluster protein [Rhodoferax sp.]|nr:YkgJ family cysteine cluster protein [Rhodoferax sp.]